MTLPAYCLSAEHWADFAVAALTHRAAGGLDLEAEERRVGGKAARLAWLDQLGVPVPPFRVLTVESFRAHLHSPVVAAALGEGMLRLAELEPGQQSPRATLASASKLLRTAVEEADLDRATQSTVAEALDALGPGPYAVRSSMI